MQETISISRNELIEILTKSGRYNAEGIETVLDNDGLYSVLEAIMLDVEHEADRAEHYKDRCRQLKEEISELNQCLDKFENDSKGDG